MRGEGRFTWLAPTLAAAAFIVLALLFAREMRAFSGAVGNWAQRDLESRAEVAARTLEEPLATQDFRAIRAFAESCRSNGLDFCVRAGGGGTVFDTRRHGEPSGPAFVAERMAGEYRFSLFLPAERVQAPFRRAIPGFAIAALLGVVGMLFVFFVVYRQRVRIRELARLERFRREFIADVSHEIKTPLTGILGAVDLLGEAGSADLRTRLLGMIRKESTRLNGLVQSILDLARLEREGEVLNRVETDLAELVRETAESFRARAEAAGVDLTVDTPAAAPISCDPQLIAQALGNLIANALRHAQSPTIHVSCERIDRGLRVIVEDRGIGIPPGEATRVFERFHRVDPSRAAETGGAGLGLAIVRRIMRLHGGDAFHEPAVPRGCRMILAFSAGVAAESVFNIRLIVRNSAFIYLRLVALIVGNLLAVRLVLEALGITCYGLVASVGAVTGLLVFLNGVLNSTAQRFLSFEIGKGAAGSLGAAFASVKLITAALCALILLIGETVGLWFVATRLSVPDGLRVVAITVYEVELLKMILVTARIPYASLVNATERMGFLAWISLVEVGLMLAVAVSLPFVPSHRPECYALLEVVSSVLLLVFFIRHARRLCPALRMRVRPSVSAVRGQCAYFLWSSLHAAVNALKYNGVGLLVNLQAGVAANAAWRLGYVYGSSLGSVYHGFQQAYFPQLVKLWTQTDRLPFRRLTLHACRWSFLPTACFGVPFLVLTEPVLHVLVGASLPPMTIAFTRCFVIHYLVDSLVEPLHSAALAPGRIAGYEIGQSVTIGLGFVLAVLAGALGWPPWTAVGAVAMATTLNLAYHLVYLRKLGFSWMELLLLRARHAWTDPLRP